MVRFGSEKTSTVKIVKSHVNGDKLNNAKPKKGFWLSKFVEFCKRTDLHGYKYIVMEDFSNMERSCWALAVLVSLGLAAYFVVTAYKWYARNPIVTIIESTQGAIWDVPFPAVTICDLNVVSRKAARELADNLTLPDNVTADFVFKTLRLIPLLHSNFLPDSEEKEQLYQLQDILDDNNITMSSLFTRLSPASSCNKLIQKCMWKNTIYRCDELFTQIFTLLSVCCTFNYFAINTDAKNEYAPQFATPRRVASCGYQTALTVLLYTNTEDYYSASVASQGVLVIIDNAYNLPDLDSPVRLLNPSTEVLIALSPEKTYATSGIKSFTPEERQCYYSDEMRIGSFRQYSFHNCMAYQKVKLLEEFCGCVPLFFPLEGHYRNCNFKDMDCIQNAVKKHESTRQNMSETQSLFKCLPECEHYDYPLEVALGKVADSVFVKGLPFFENVVLENRSMLNVFFNDLVSTTYRRDVYLNWQNILAAFGGLLSLMLGFTLISGFDLLLFVTVRICAKSCSSVYHNYFVQHKVHVKDFFKKDNQRGVNNRRANLTYGKDFYDGKY